MLAYLSGDVNARFSSTLFILQTLKRKDSKEKEASRRSPHSGRIQGRLRRDSPRQAASRDKAQSRLLQELLERKGEENEKRDRTMKLPFHLKFKVKT
jgi:hypothetical protein